MGWGVIDVDGLAAYPCRPWRDRHQAPPAGSGLRLLALHRELRAVIAEHAPAAIAVEQAFVAKDPPAALKLGHARAVALLAAAQAGLEIAEYAPNHIKKCVVGAGHAGKEQVQFMVQAAAAGLRRRRRPMPPMRWPRPSPMRICPARARGSLAALA